jgi:heat-inducible transcriptional repressor
MKDNTLSSRKQKILKAVVDEYIKNDSPISSAAIQERYLSNVSTATIRSELSNLEDMGYLIKPHTSAGRIPSKMAYKTYVENFIQSHPLNREEIEIIHRSFEKRYTKMSEIVRQTAKIISDLTNYTSVMLVSDIKKVRIKEIKLLALDEKQVLVVIITDSGIIRDNVISLSSEVNEQYVQEANLILNNVFYNRTLNEVKNFAAEVEKELADYKELFNCIIEIMEEQSGQPEALVLEGASKIADYPEVSAKNFLSVIDNKKEIINLLDKKNGIEFAVTIGKDDEDRGIEGCAVVSVKYTINGEEFGRAGVIGPQRMDYNKVMSVLEHVGKTLEIVTKKDLDEDGK